jgi:hypothetical protein
LGFRERGLGGMPIVCGSLGRKSDEKKQETEDGKFHDEKGI